MPDRPWIEHAVRMNETGMTGFPVPALRDPRGVGPETVNFDQVGRKAFQLPGHIRSVSEASRTEGRGEGNRNGIPTSEVGLRMFVLHRENSSQFSSLDEGTGKALQAQLDASGLSRHRVDEEGGFHSEPESCEIDGRCEEKWSRITTILDGILSVREDSEQEVVEPSGFPGG